MATITKVKKDGSWVEPSHIWVKQGGTWRDCQKVFVKQSGIWSQVFPNYAPGSIQWTNASTHNFTVPAGVFSLSYVVIGGGAGGGGGSEKDPMCSGGGGGGAGALVTGTLSVIPGQILTCVVGIGGDGFGAIGGGAAWYASASTINSTLVVANPGGNPRTYNAWHRPYGGYSGNANSQDGGNGHLTEADSTPANGGSGGGVPGYSSGGTGGTGSGAAGVGPGAGGGGGATTGENGGNYGGGNGNDGMIRLVW